MTATTFRKTGFPAFRKSAFAALLLSATMLAGCATNRTPQFSYENGMFRAPVALAPGNWIIHVTAEAWDGTQFRQRIDHFSGSRVKG